MIRLILKEHKTLTILSGEPGAKNLSSEDGSSLAIDTGNFSLLAQVQPRKFKEERDCFSIEQRKDACYLKSDYYIGVDWLLAYRLYVQVEPKINDVVKECFEKQLNIKDDNEKNITAFDKEAENKITVDNAYREINFLKMLLDAMSDSQIAGHCTGLIYIDWEAPQISIPQHQDQLTPFLIVQFLQILKQIVRKGLKKSYYKVQENLNNRVKGKILVGQHIKQNIFKNKVDKTFCTYQVFGANNTENRFLKKVLNYVSSYVENNTGLFQGNANAIEHLIHYGRPAFEHIGDDIQEYKLKHFQDNPFFKEYKEATRIGQYILKRFAYNITQTTETKAEIPPFWIDMPTLFEMYVYQQLLQANPEKSKQIQYSFSTYGNTLDILIADGDYSMIIDAKYKLHYKHSQVHRDIRQVAGYARLNRVREELGITDDRNIDCLIIYPDMENGIEAKEAFNLQSIRQSFEKPGNKIHPYHKVYKLGVKLPVVKKEPESYNAP